MTQIDMFQDLKPKIYESPDGGQTIYSRDFGNTERTQVKTAIQQQWTIVYNTTEVSLDDALRLL